MKPTSDSIVVVSPDQVSADLSPSSEASKDEVVVLNLENGQYYELTDVGARIWELMQEPTRCQVIVETLVGEYDVEHRTCELDVLELLTELGEQGLIQISHE